MPFSDAEIDRYGRQMLLPEWGAAGQERVRASTLQVYGRGAAAAIAARYLAGAGIGTLRLDLDAEIATALNPDVSVEPTLPIRICKRPPPAILITTSVDGDEVSIEADDDREAVGAACAVEALKAILGLPHLTRVSLPHPASLGGVA